MDKKAVTINTTATLNGVVVFKMSIELPFGLSGIDGKFDEQPLPSTDNGPADVTDEASSLRGTATDWLTGTVAPSSQPFNYSKSVTEDNLRQLGYKVAGGQQLRGMDDATIWIKDGYRAVFVDGNRGFFSAHQGCRHPVPKTWFEMFLA
jgi:hypothetical protein